MKYPSNRIWRALMDARYWLRSRFHPNYRYHVVKTGLSPGYYDEDTLILHSCMALLVRFISWHDGEQALEKFTNELRDSKQEHEQEVCDRQATIQSEALAIYRWWKYRRPLDEKRLEDLWATVPPGVNNPPGTYDRISDLENKMLDDEQIMLHRLIDIRPSLWE